MLEDKVKYMESELKLGRLGACGAEIFAMLSALSRASKSYSQGQFEGELEADLARLLCQYGSEKVMVELDKVILDQKAGRDFKLMNAANQLFDYKGYNNIMHPITKMVPDSQHEDN